MGKCRYDLSEDCNNKDCLICMLYKIRTKIIELPTISLNANDIYKADVLQILDKYKTEIEPQESEGEHCHWWDESQERSE